MRTYVAAAALWAFAASAAPPIDQPLPQPALQVVERISANSLRGNVSFLSSDLLEGRDTPSRGLSIAAEFIAGQFRRSGLAPPPGSTTYFQTANWKARVIPKDGLRVALTADGKTWTLTGEQVTAIVQTRRDIENLPVVKVTLDALNFEEGSLEGKVILVMVPTFAEMRGSEADLRRVMRQVSDLNQAVSRARPALVVGIRDDDQAPLNRYQIDLPFPEESSRSRATQMTLYSREIAAWWRQQAQGDTAARITAKVPEAKEETLALHNVIAVVPGSDPALKDEALVISAHYDHIGIGEAENGDRIYNGANDDASGTAALIELAYAFGAARERPKRTIVLLAMFGEERGLYGARHYLAQPLFTPAKTIGNLNLEHLGRTDGNDGPHAGKLYPTGFEYSDMPAVLQTAGKAVGIEVKPHAENEAFFARSDNVAFARLGIPAHTVCVTFEFPDYHGAGDHWEKIDYENFAKVTRAIAAGAWLLADAPKMPSWSTQSTRTERYREARTKSLGNNSEQ